MAFETFSWPVTIKTQGAVRFATLDSQFGDGYSASAVDGLRRQARRQSWPVRVVGSLAELQDATDFLDRHAGAKRFLWLAPGDQQPTYFRAKGYQKLPQGGQLWTLDATFEYAGTV